VAIDIFKAKQVLAAGGHQFHHAVFNIRSIAGGFVKLLPMAKVRLQITHQILQEGLNPYFLNQSPNILDS
jgi:hypothetical protein